MQIVMKSDISVKALVEWNAHKLDNAHYSAESSS